MGDIPINIRTLVHHIEHLVLYSLILWQFGLCVWLILRWVNKNWKIKKTFSVTSPTTNPSQTIQPVINIDGSNIKESIKDTKKDMGAVEVNFKKDIFIDSADNTDIVSDEKIKGKVKTQKDKLKKLRGK
jgi:hypothetical protein